MITIINCASVAPIVSRKIRRGSQTQSEKRTRSDRMDDSRMTEIWLMNDWWWIVDRWLMDDWWRTKPRGRSKRTKKEVDKRDSFPPREALWLIAHRFCTWPNVWRRGCLTICFIIVGTLLAAVKAPEQLDAALWAYDQVRRPRNLFIVESSRITGQIITGQGAGVGVDVEKI